MENKYQKALDEIKISYLPSGSYSFPNSYYLKEQIDTLQELVNLRLYLIEEYNKVLTLQGSTKRAEQWEELRHYGNGIRFALDYIDKEDEDA
jgi:hypothetical protein